MKRLILSSESNQPRRYVAIPKKIYSDSDLDFLQEAYGFDLNSGHWIAASNGKTFIITPQIQTITLSVQASDSNTEKVVIFNDFGSLLTELDSVYSDSIFCSVSYYTSEESQAILAARLNRTQEKNKKQRTKDATRNMVRVKSSNVWSYSINIKSAGDNVGDVYVQFKDKHGGPGDIYVYYDVPVKLWRKFITAPSKGNFVWRYLRNNFWYSRLTGNKRGVLPNAIN